MLHGRENEKRTNISSGRTREGTSEDMGDKIIGNTLGTSQVWDLASSASASAISIVNSGVAKASDSLTKLVQQARTNQDGVYIILKFMYYIIFIMYHIILHYVLYYIILCTL